jgi:hypothetical protein
MLIIVQTVTSNFTAYTVERMHRRKHEMYMQSGFEIQSLNSLVCHAKQETAEKLDLHQDNDCDDGTVRLPFHVVTEHLMESVQQLHHHLQGLMISHLGSDARHVITAERARQASVLKQQAIADKGAEQNEGESQPKKSGDEYVIAKHLSEVGQEHGADELELLNEYRRRYATILAQLLVAKDRLVDYEKGLVRDDQAQNEALKKRIEDELEELGEDSDLIPRRNWRKRRSSEW